MATGRRISGEMEMPAFLRNGGELGELIATFDWSSTSLGHIQGWSTTLRSNTALILRSPVPIVTLWGEDGVMIYNDAYSSFAGGRHPVLLGSKVREGWPEVAEFNDNVMKVGLAGGTLSYRDQELTLHRYGRPEQVWMNLDYSPILDEEGQTVGVIAIVVETTGKVVAERHLSGQHERFRQMFEQTPGFVALLQGPDHRFTMANAAYQRLVGGRDVVGKPIREALPEVAEQGFVDLLDEVFESRQAHAGWDTKVVINGDDGVQRARFVDFIYQPITNPSGAVTGILVQGSDVTDRRHSNEALEEREAQLSAYISQSVAGFGQVDLTGLFTLVNDRFCEITGRTREELLGLRMQDITHPEDLPANIPKFEKAVRDGTPYVHEKRYVRPDGSIIWVSNSVSLLRRANGEPYGVLAVTLDVTERHEAEAAVRENEARLRALTENLPGGMVFQISTGSDGSERKFLFVSPSFEKLTGIPAQAAMEDPTIPYQTILPEDRPALQAAEAKAIEERSVFDVEARFRRTDGEVRWARIISAPRQQPDGSLIWDGIKIDISEQKKAEAALRESEERLASALIIARLGTFSWNLETDDVHFDARSRDLFGFAEDRPISGADVFSRVHPDDIDQVLKDVNRARTDGLALRTDYRICVEGTVRHIVSLSDAVMDGSTMKMVGVFDDVTDQKRLEDDLHRLNESLEERVRERTMELERVHEQLRQSQKLEAMGQLTGGVAHDFNNLLTPIIGSLDLLQRRNIGSEREQRMIGGALDSAERAKTLVQRLLAFARRQPLQRGAVRLHEVVGTMSDLVASTSGPTIKLLVDVSHDLPPANADQNQLEMAILNLCVNARDAMPDGGNLTISAGLRQIGPGHRSNVQPGEYLCLSVADTGIGMDADTMAKAIEPFFSTKGIGKGTGLGLSMVHGLASQLGGALLLSSKPGLGTTIDILLPKAADAPVQKEAIREMPKHDGAGLVLLVDDEAGVRASTTEMLIELGFTVMAVDSARSAIAWLRGNRPDFVVTDHLMPGMSGTDLAEVIARDFPGMPVLIVSGYADIDDISPSLPRLAKPFRQAELAASMSALREKSRASTSADLAKLQTKE